jgi:succinoglycan biosynthesis transport protein ExoP
LIEAGPYSGDPDYTRYSTLRDWIAVIFRQRRLVVVCFCGTLLGTCLFAWLWAARYFESSMQILVMPDQMAAVVPSPSSAPALSNQVVSEGEINSEMALLQGEDLLQQVVVSCDLNKQSGITDSFLASDAPARAQAKVEHGTRWLAQSLHVAVAKQADVINVSFGAVGPREKPTCVLATLGRLYLEKRLQLRRPAGLLDFFTQETEKYQRLLGTAEEELATFGVQDAVAPDIQRTLVAQKLVETQAALREAQQAVAEDAQRLRSQLQQLGATSPRVVTQEHDQAAGELLQQLEPQLLAAQLRREQLSMKFAPGYPLLKEADQEVLDAQAAVASAEEMQLRDQTTDRDSTFELLRQEVAKARADIAGHQASASVLRQSIHALQDQAVQLDQETIRFQGLVRDAKANEENYLLYLSKREQERSAEALDDRRIANVSIAVPPSVPILPAYSPFKVLTIGLLLALILGVTAAFVGEYLDGSFRTPADVADMLGVTVLASMPKQAA